MEPKWPWSETNMTKVTLKWPRFYRLLYTCWGLAMLVLSMLYEFSIVCWPLLSLLIFHVTASQLFVNCWVRAAASIVRAKRCYFDDILNNLFENTLFFFSSYVFLSYSLFLGLFCSFFSLSSSHIQVASSCNRKRRFPFIATTDFKNVIPTEGGKHIFGTLGFRF